MTEVDALQRGLESLHQAIYAYGLAGAHLRQAGIRRLALDRLRELQQQRDRLELLVRRGGATPTPAAVGYAPPTPAVVDQSSALQLMAGAENAVAAAAWDLVAASGGSSPTRLTAVALLESSAVAGWQWALAAGPTDISAGLGPALPGQPS